jgi:hypothetical protein
VRRVGLGLGCLAAVVLIWSPTAIAAPQTLYSCGPGAGTGDRIDRGFYVTGYPGPNLHSVTLAYKDNLAPGSHTISLTAHLGTYDGAVIGSTSITGNVTGTGFTPMTFVFSDPAVAAGSTIAFVQELVSAPPSPFLLYDYTNGTCAGVIETEGTNPPLDSPRSGGRGIATTITSNPSVPVAPIQTHRKRCKKRKHRNASIARKKCKRHKHRAV